MNQIKFTLSSFLLEIHNFSSTFNQKSGIYYNHPTLLKITCNPKYSRFFKIFKNFYIYDYKFYFNIGSCIHICLCASWISFKIKTKTLYSLFGFFVRQTLAKLIPQHVPVYLAYFHNRG